MYAFVAFVAILGTLSLASAAVLPRDVVQTVTSTSIVVVAPEPTPDSTIGQAIASTTTVFVAAEPSSISNDKPTPVVVEPERPTETCHTNFKVVLDDFTIKGAGWDPEKLHRPGHPGGGLRHELGGCGVITHWSFKEQEPSVKNGPWEFIAHGQTGIFQALCIEHAMKSAGAPNVDSGYSDPASKGQRTGCKQPV
ncbi:hypothetical protein LTR97_004286 [Elasticomyces elasticus]|uniref:Uncharacterized protein n=1 Tax=Elasticomyces elasticus TaxID=574655 RepID=A0AAN8A369_9PEZI|nr:hypothetical protein LTR97_004286 [Elasticomyces elasticus]KAK5711576.1 hypothetical protein LTR15_012418 [Elasticomyces elasticus]